MVPMRVQSWEVFPHPAPPLSQHAADVSQAQQILVADNYFTPGCLPPTLHFLMSPPIPENEPDRLAALHASGLLDTPSEIGFDDIAVLASHICQTPISLISLVDADRQWFKAKIGIDAPETPREVSFCTHAICAPNELFVVPDATIDDRFRENALVTSEPRIRFYAGMPLTDPAGFALGTICVIDRQPRELTDAQRHALKALSRQVGVLLAANEANRRLSEENERRKSLERRLRERADNFRDLLENAGDIIQSVAPDGRFLYVNKAWQTILGYSAEEAATMNAFDIIAPASRKHCGELFERVCGGESLPQIETRFLTKNGAEIQVAGTVTCRIENEIPVATRGIFRVMQPPDYAADTTNPSKTFTCICGWCKMIRDENNEWEPLESHFERLHGTEFTHGICASCADKAMADLETSAN